MRAYLFLITVGLATSACSLSKHLQFGGTSISGSGGDGSSALRDEDIVVVEAEPGRAVVGPMKPTWCDRVEVQRTSSGEINRTMGQIAEQGWYAASLDRMAPLLCASPRDRNIQRQTGYMVQSWINMTGQSKDEALASIHARLDSARWQAERDAVCSKLEVRSEASEQEQSLVKAHRIFFGCNDTETWPAWWGGNNMDASIEWYVDTSASAPSELARLYQVLSCVPRSTRTLDEWSYVRHGLCGQDARALDAGRLERELAGYNGYAQVLGREALVRARTDFARLEQVVAQLAKQDEAYRTLLVDTPRAAWKAWEEDHASHKKAIDAARAFERKLFGTSRKAMRGCGSSLRKGFEGYIARMQPRDREAFQAAATAPVGMILLEALMACEAAEGRHFLAAQLDLLRSKGRSARGPRHAVYHAMIDALNELREDRERFPIEPNMLGTLRESPVRAAAHDMWASKTIGGEETKGEVANVTREGDSVRLTFKTVKWQEDKQKCQQTSKIWRIHNDGRIEYQLACKTIGKEWKSSTHPPTLIPAELAEGIAPGAFIELRVEIGKTSANGERLGFPVAVYDSKAKKQLLAAYGVRL